jgi:ribosomal RNA-processing protein 17
MMASTMLEEGIFRHPRPKKSTLPPLLKKRKLDYKIEEISFDTSAREDYLTGFHKRKVARTKQAQAEAAKKAKEEKIALRKQVRLFPIFVLGLGLCWK